MAEKPDAMLAKLSGIASDMELPVDIRLKAIEAVAKINTHDALVVLLNLAANEKSTSREKELILKLSAGIVKSSD